MDETERLIGNFYLSMAARIIVRADPSFRYTSMLLRRKASKQATDMDEDVYRGQVAQVSA